MINDNLLDKHQSTIKRLKDSMSETKKEINDKIVEISLLIMKIEPYDLMNDLTNFALLELLSHESIASEIDISLDVVKTDRAIEYVHSLIVSLKSGSDYEVYDETIAEEILNKTKELYDLTNSKYFLGSECNSSNINRTRLASLYHLRGNLYQCFISDYFTILLEKQNELLMQAFNITSSDIIEGLNAINFGHTFDIFNASNKIDFENNVTDIESFETVYTIEKYNVKKLTNWNEEFLESLSMKPGECTTFLNDKKLGWINESLPIQQKPLLCLKGGYYYFNYYNFFDNFYRCIQKAIFNKDKSYINKWNDNQKNSSETNIIKYFAEKLKFEEYYISNYFYDDTKKKYENDGFIVFEDKILIFEFKAGSLSPKSPLYDFESYIKNFNEIYNSGIKQAIRFASQIANNVETIIYDDRGNMKATLKQQTLDNVYIFVVCVDALSEATASFEKNDYADFDIMFQPILISLADLLIYCDYFETRIELFHFLNNRRKSILNSRINLFDELDHLGLYIAYNDYSKFVESIDISNDDNLYWYGFKAGLDKYYSLKFMGQSIEKPKLKLPKIVWQIIGLLDKNDYKINNSVNVGKTILKMLLEEDNKNKLIEYIESEKQKSKNKNIGKPIFVFSNENNWAFACIHDLADKDKIFEDIITSLIGRIEKTCNILLLYIGTNNEIYNVQYLLFNINDLDREEIIKHQLRYQLSKNKIDNKPTVRKERIGRNDPCPCGSQKKYKVCCMLDI